MLRLTKILLIGTVCLWGYVGGILNITDWGGTLGAVTAAVSMSTFEGGADAFQATTNTLVVWLGACFIMLSKLTAGTLCGLGAWRMWQARQSDSASFQAAKGAGLTGCAVAMIMLFGGFIVIAESWFELWRSDVMRGPVLESAFRYGAMIMLIGLFVAPRDED